MNRKEIINRTEEFVRRKVADSKFTNANNESSYEVIGDFMTELGRA